MFKNASDLSALFADSPAPRRIADAVRTKIEKFKVCPPALPILHPDGHHPGPPLRAGDDLQPRPEGATLGPDGGGARLRCEARTGDDPEQYDRWVHDGDRDDLNPSCLDAGVHKLGERLQEISGAASKEFALEKAMAKMKGEWEQVFMSCRLHPICHCYNDHV